MPIDVSPERFDELVDDALDAIPDELARLVSNLVVLVEEEPPAGEPDDLLGLYDGRGLVHDMYGGDLPARILVFRGPLLDFCETEEQLVDEVRITVVHELAHHFGIDEAKLHQLGWG
ncbi:metallopeptidase family protein [Nocardioides sp.]|uniref:metallopeptidase family protein n=1 Tax=Nocardioides sp. TaxID=35761 RepID=UPI0039E47BB6